MHRSRVTSYAALEYCVFIKIGLIYTFNSNMQKVSLALVFQGVCVYTVRANDFCEKRNNLKIIICSEA